VRCLINCKHEGETVNGELTRLTLDTPNWSSIVAILRSPDTDIGLVEEL
jgi:hypothetical protein